MTEQQRRTIGKLMRTGTGYQDDWSSKEKDGILEGDWDYMTSVNHGFWQRRQCPPGYPQFFNNQEVRKMLG